MKYLLTILSIVCVITAVSLFFLWPKKQTAEQDIAATINGHNLARTTLTESEHQTGYHQANKNDLLDSAITRELLLQEAQRQAIDKEPSFSASLKSFYEQSLIKVLLDRQYQNTEANVTEDEIKTFLACFGKRVIFSRLAVADTSPQNITTKQGQQTSAIFDDLAEPVQVLISTLKPGEFAVKYDTGSDQYAIRLDSIVDTSTSNSTMPDREAVRHEGGEITDLSAPIAAVKASGGITAVAADHGPRPSHPVPWGPTSHSAPRNVSVSRWASAAARRVFRHPRRTQALCPRPHHWRFGRCTRQQGAAYGTANTRTAYPPRKSQFEHLHLTGSAYGRHVRRLSWPARLAQHCRADSSADRDPC